jgi:protein-L-isoaspartate(D-aspartate) O-methyltransferase
MEASDERAAMVARLRADGVVTTASVEQALLAVERELFVPTSDPTTAYEDHAVIVKRSPQGRPTSSVSQPTIVAIMLEALAVRPGDRVLEIGTGRGYNAALLGHLVGPAGRVVSVEIDAELARTAADRLGRAGVRPVQVVCADGRLGHRPAAPFDRIIVTTGARRIEPELIAQLRPGGVLVTPVVDRAGRGDVVRCERLDDGMTRHTLGSCAFVPILTEQTPTDLA